jgi:hypothetical protein
LSFAPWKSIVSLTTTGGPSVPTTNVVYNVQGLTNLLGSWTTLGRVATSATNFSFTNWNNGPRQFYRLTIP